MSDNHPNELPESLLSDEPILKDATPPSKLPWIIAAVVIVLLVMGVQWGGRLLMLQLTEKTQQSNADMMEEKGEFNALPMPHAIKKVSAKPSTNPHNDVVGYLQEKKVEQSQELARLRMISRLEERQRSLKENEAMIQSPALLNIGVGHQKPTNEGEGRQGVQTQYSSNPNTAYLKSISNQPVEEVSAGRFGDLRFRIRKGKILRGVTESAIDSDLPGLIRGHVTENVYGDQGELVLIPNGAGLVGEYRSGGISNGQISLYVVWTRVQLSNGIYVTLDSAGSDPLGRAGMTGPIDHHYLQRFGSSLLSSFFSVSVATLGVQGSDQYNSEAAYRAGLSNAFAQTANQEFQQNAAIQTTIRPPQGTEISILVNKDISFETVLTADGSPS